jgi:hypothetical protein
MNEGRFPFRVLANSVKLADNQEITRNLLHGKIHGSVLIREDSNPDDLTGQPNDVISRICGLNAKEHQ